MTPQALISLALQMPGAYGDYPLGAVPDGVIREMLGHSYETVVGKLPKYKRERLKAAAQALRQEVGR